VETFTLNKEDILSFEVIEDNSDVYDITVEDNHNFYLKTNDKDILVHNSSKSFNVALFSLNGVVDHCYKILYSRFTNTSIGDSIKLEVSDKIEVLNYEDKVIDNQYRIESKVNDGFISFKGIKTSSKGQTANLKSLSGFNIFIVDEAEEIPSFETFKKVYYSIRSVDKRNLSILILNPTTKEHWIYQEYFKKMNIADGFCGVVDNVMYIHSSYKDVNPKYIPENLKLDYEKLKESDPTEYDNVVLGGWITDPKGSLFKRSELKYYTELSQEQKESCVGKVGFVDVADSGTDDHSVPIGYLIGSKIYIEDVLYTQQGTEFNVDLTAAIIDKHKPEYVRVETNFGGSMYISLLQPKINQVTALMPIRATTNKHSRIVTMSGFIKEYVVFKKDYEHGTDYHRFMQCVYNYLADGKAEHDDAPDSLEGLCALIRQFYPHLWS